MAWHLNLFSRTRIKISSDHNKFCYTKGCKYFSSIWYHSLRLALQIEEKQQNLKQTVETMGNITSQKHHSKETDTEVVTDDSSNHKELAIPQLPYGTGIKLPVTIPEERLSEDKNSAELCKAEKPKFITKKVFQRVGKVFPVKLTNDEADCSISGSAFLPNGNIVLADFNNKRLKLFDVNLKNLSYVDLKVSPQNLCTRQQESEVYVTFNDSSNFQHGIKVVTVNEDNAMTVVRVIKLSDPCYGISSNNGGLAVVVNTSDGWQIHLVTLKGVLKACVKPESGSKKLLIRPDHIAIAKDLRLLISDRGNNSVFCFNTNGDLIFQYSRLRQPMGMALDSQGSIFVACPGMVQQINMGGERIASLMGQEDTGFPPICLSYDEDDSLLVVAGQSNFMVAYKLTDYKVKK